MPIELSVVPAETSIALVDGFTKINAVVQEPIEITLADQRALLAAKIIRDKWALSIHVNTLDFMSKYRKDPKNGRVSEQSDHYRQSRGRP